VCFTWHDFYFCVLKFNEFFSHKFWFCYTLFIPANCSFRVLHFPMPEVPFIIFKCLPCVFKSLGIVIIEVYSLYLLILLSLVFQDLYCFSSTFWYGFSSSASLNVYQILFGCWTLWLLSRWLFIFYLLPSNILKFEQTVKLREDLLYPFKVCLQFLFVVSTIRFLQNYLNFVLMFGSSDISTECPVNLTMSLLSGRNSNISQPYENIELFLL
jgi:hypothetical protein